MGRPSSPRKSHHGETSDRRDDPQEHGHITSDPNNPRMKVDFPRWEGDPIGWISCTERYFRFYRTADATRVEIAAIHLEGDAIQCHTEAYCPLYCHPSPRTKKLTRDELRERSAKGLCWHCNEPWSREHRCKKGRLLMIEPVEDEDNEPSEEGLEPEEEAIEEEPQPADYAVHALAGYSNPQTMKVGGLLKQQPITVLIDTGSTNNFLNSKVAARLALQIE
ncbi:hypothetical protein GW17_00025357, partial [Ensete ventricosum]